MKEVTLDYCNELMDKYNSYKEIAEQHQFPLLLLMDTMLIPAHKDLNKNYTQEHGETFVRGMKNSMFPKLGIAWEDE